MLTRVWKILFSYANKRNGWKNEYNEYVNTYFDVCTFKVSQTDYYLLNLYLQTDYYLLNLSTNLLQDFKT